VKTLQIIPNNSRESVDIPKSLELMTETLNCFAADCVISQNENYEVCISVYKNKPLCYS
jgi:hypothetical protein